MAADRSDRSRDWITLLTNQGLAVFLVVAGGYYMTMHIVAPMVASHQEFLHEQIDLSKQQAQTMAGMEGLLRQQSQLLGQQSQMISDAQKQHEVQIRLLEQSLGTVRSTQTRSKAEPPAG